MGRLSKFQWVLHLGFVTAATSFNGSRQTLHDVWPSLGLVHYIYIFGGFCPLTEFCQLQNSLCVQICVLLYWQRYCTALEHWASAKHCGVEQRAPHIFGMAAITLVIGPHSGSFFFSSPNLSGRRLDVYHTSTHGVALVQIYNACLKYAGRGLLKIQDAKKLPKIHYLRTITQLYRAVSSQLRHISTIGQKLLNSNISLKRCHSMVNFGLSSG